CVRELARHGYRFLSEKSGIVALSAGRHENVESPWGGE
ncbi:MAG: hypothetical protein H6Q80_1523, partial [Deltaproteobacteria bacterium]|nr:hypothetical protein [Deltaproteobacteria bacterium]